MPDIVVDTTVTAAGDGQTSFQEAIRQAVRQSIQSGEEVTIRFAGAMNVVLTETVNIRHGADIVIDGTVEGGGNSVGSSDVNFLGNGRQVFDTYTMMQVQSGAALRLVDVTLTDNLVAGGNGRNGASGDDGLDGNDGEEEDTNGTPGNGGLSVATHGADGRDAAGGILNRGELVLDRVNLNHLFAYGGDGGNAGVGGNGGDGGDGNSAPGGPGGPGGSGLGSGGDGGDAAAGVLNLGNLTLIDTWFQGCVASAGDGGSSGRGGNGGGGGTGTVGGFGGNGGLGGGTGGTGGDAAATILNRGTMTVVGGWVDGSNVIQPGGNGGAGGLGGRGGAGGEGSEMDGFDGVGGAGGNRGQDGTSGEILGHAGNFAPETILVRTTALTASEFGGAWDGGNLMQLTFVRLGGPLPAGAQITVSLTGLDGATGAGIQGGLFTDRVVTFGANQAMASIFLFTTLDGAALADQRYELTITGATGAVLGGNLTSILTVTNSEIVGDATSERLGGTQRAEVILGGLGNDTLQGRGGDDKLDGQGGIDWVDYSDVQSRNGNGLVLDMFAFRASGRGIGSDMILNIENVIGSAFDDRMTGDFSSNEFRGGRGRDRLDGGFGNDRLLGQQGADRLFGGDQQDTLNGGEGRDVLTGGNGFDVFLFNTGPVADLASHRDRITDFNAAQDVIHLGRSGAGPFDDIAFGTLAANAFHAGANATRASHRIIYDEGTGTLYYDRDGKGGAAKVAFAVLDGAPEIGAADFFVV